MSWLFLFPFCFPFPEGFAERAGREGGSSAFSGRAFPDRRLEPDESQALFPGSKGQGQEGTRRGTRTWKGQDPSATHVATMGWPQYVPKSSPCVLIMSSMVSPMCPKYVPHEVPQCVPNMCPMHPPSMSPTCSQRDPSMSSWCPQPVSSVSPVFPIVSSPCSQCVPNVSPNTSPMSCHTVSSICP